MNMLHAVGDFFLSAWIWNITFDMFHPFATGVIMFLMMRIVLRIKRIPSLIITIGAQSFAFIVLYLLVNNILIDLFQWTYEPLSDPYYALVQFNELYATLSLGMIYALLQTVYFVLGQFVWNYNLIAVVMIGWISNGIGMVISYLFVRMMILVQYAQ